MKTVLEIESIILFLMVVLLTYKYVRVLLVERKNVWRVVSGAVMLQNKGLVVFRSAF